MMVFLVGKFSFCDYLIIINAKAAVKATAVYLLEHQACEPQKPALCPVKLIGGNRKVSDHNSFSDLWIEPYNVVSIHFTILK